LERFFDPPHLVQRQSRYASGEDRDTYSCDVVEVRHGRARETIFGAERHLDREASYPRRDWRYRYRPTPFVRRIPRK
jgi:hypothetical protein